MRPPTRNLGKLIAVHPTAPAYIQRAAVVAILSFLFFVGMLVVFLFCQHFMYLILAAAFFIVNIFTLFGFLLQRRNAVRIYENGLTYGKTSVTWNEISTAKRTESGEIRIEASEGEPLMIPKTIDRINQISQLIDRHLAS